MLYRPVYSVLNDLITTVQQSALQIINASEFYDTFSAAKLPIEPTPRDQSDSRPDYSLSVFSTKCIPRPATQVSGRVTCYAFSLSSA